MAKTAAECEAECRAILEKESAAGNDEAKKMLAGLSTMLKKMAGKEVGILQMCKKKFPQSAGGAGGGGGDASPAASPAAATPKAKPATAKPATAAASAAPTAAASSSPASPTAATAGAGGGGGGERSDKEKEIISILELKDKKMVPTVGAMLKKFSEDQLLGMMRKKHIGGLTLEEYYKKNPSEAPTTTTPTAATAASPTSATATAAAAKPKIKPKPKPTATTPALTHEEATKARIVRFYEKYDPSKVKDLETIYKDYCATPETTEKMFGFLVKKYGEEPPAPTVSSSASSPSQQQQQQQPQQQGTREQVTKARIVRFYEKYDPKKVKDVDIVYKDYCATPESTEKMFGILVNKYGVEPPAPQSSSSSPSPAAAASQPTPTATPAAAGGGGEMDPTDEMREILTLKDPKMVKTLPSMIAKFAEKPNGQKVLLTSLRKKHLGGLSLPEYRQKNPNESTAASASSPTAASVTPTPTPVAAESQPQPQQEIQPQIQQQQQQDQPQPQEQVPQQQQQQQQQQQPQPQTQTQQPQVVLPQSTEEQQEQLRQSQQQAAQAASASSPSHLLTVSKQNYVPSTRDALLQFYAKYDTSKIPSIDANVAKYAGKEKDMWNFLENKYGKCPEITPVSTRAARILEHYDPQNLSQLETHLKTFRAAGNDDEQLIVSLTNKYGPEPAHNSIAAATSPPSSSAFAKEEGGEEYEQVEVEDPKYANMSDLQARCRRMYEKYDPMSLSAFFQTIERYKGREGDLLQQLIQRHGPEPEYQLPTTRRKKKSSSKRAREAERVKKGLLAVDTELYRRIQAMLEKYDSDQASPQQIDIMLERYRGKEHELLRTLVAQYGEEPPLREMPDREVLAQRAANVMQHYDPASADQLPALLERFAGREDKLLRTLVRRFGPEKLEDLGGVAREAAIPPTSGENIGDIRKLISKHEPESAAAIPGLLQRYNGKEETLLSLLRQRYGTSINVQYQDPTSPETNKREAEDPRIKNTEASLEARIRNLLSKYNPEAVEHVPKLVTEYNERVVAEQHLDKETITNEGAELLLKDLISKHGPEPVMPSSSSSSSNNNQNATSAATAAAGGVGGGEEGDQQQKPKQQQQQQQEEGDGNKITYREKLTALFTHYDRLQLSQVDDYLERYRGREEEMLVAAHKKFSVPPPKPIPEWVKPLQKMCLAMGMDELFLERLVNAMGSSTSKENVTFELLLIWFPDFVMSLMTDEGQKRTLVAKRLARFLSLMSTTRVREIPEMLQTAGTTSEPETVMGDMLLTFFNQAVQSAAVPRLDHSSLKARDEQGLADLNKQGASNNNKNDKKEGNVGAGFIGNVDQLQRLLDIWHLQRHHTRTPAKMGDSATDLIRFPRIVHRSSGPDEFLVKPLRTIGTDTESDEVPVFGSNQPAQGKTLVNNSSSAATAAAGGGGGTGAVAASPPNPLLFSRFGVDNDPVPKGKWACPGCHQLREYATAAEARYQHQLRDQEMRLWKLMESTTTTSPKETSAASSKNNNNNTPSSSSSSSSSSSCTNCKSFEQEIKELRHKIHQLSVNIDTRTLQLNNTAAGQQQQTRRMFQLPAELAPPPVHNRYTDSQSQFHAHSSTISAADGGTTTISPALQRSADLWKSLYGSEKPPSTPFAAASIPSAEAKKVLSML